MKELAISQIPIELFYSISQYLCSVEFFHLSQTSSHFRNIFHTLLYKYCCFFDEENDGKLKDFTTTIYKWVVPSKVIYSPERYSWFENEAVVSITIQESPSYEKIARMIPISKYPMLEEIFRPSISGGWLRLGDCGNPKRIEKGLGYNDTRITTNDYISVAKNPQYFVKANYQQFHPDIKERLFSVYNCATLEAKMYIRWILVDLGSDSAVSTAFHASLYKLESFPNLKTVMVCNSTQTSLADIKAVYTSLPKCSKLEKVKIVHKWDGDIKKLELLNELATCNWTMFSLAIVEEHHGTVELPMNFELKIPTVTILDIPNLLYLPAIKTQPVALRQFHFDHTFISIPFPLKEFNSIINNIAELVIRFHHVSDIKENHIFRKQLPNIKILKIELEIHRANQEDPITFMSALKRVPFGEFDMRNAKHSVPLMLDLVNELPKDVYLETIEPLLASSQTNTEAKLKQFVEKASLDDIFNLYYAIKLHVANLKETQSYTNYKLDCILDLLYLDVLEYMPNLEQLEINLPPNIENCFTLHRLIKHHKKLKRLELTEFETELFVSPKDIDESYKRFYDSQFVFTAYVKDGVSIATVSSQWNYITRFDIQSFRDGYKEPLDYLDIIESPQYKDNFEFQRDGYILIYRRPFPFITL